MSIDYYGRIRFDLTEAEVRELYEAQAAAERAAAEERERLAREEAERIKARKEAEVAAVHQQWREMVAEADRLRTELPDLIFAVVVFPNFIEPPEAQAWLRQKRQELQAAAQLAQEILTERNSLKREWEQHQIARQSLNMEIGICNRLMAETEANETLPAIPSAPSQQANSQAVKESRQELESILQQVQAIRNRLEARAKTQQNSAYSGEAVSTVTASVELQQVLRQEKSKRQQEIRAEIEATLVGCELNPSDLPPHIQHYVNHTVENSYSPVSVCDLLKRHSETEFYKQKSLELLNNQPELIDSERSQLRWKELRHRLDMVVNGLSSWDHSLETTYQQIVEEARIESSHNFWRSRVVSKAKAHGFKILDSADDELLIMELDGFPDHWVEISQHETKDHSTHLDMNVYTNKSELSEEEAVAAKTICSKVHAIVDDKNYPAQKTSGYGRSRRKAERPKLKSYAATLS
ncbi:MAG: hypothetical protein QM523_02515 [Candidatus Pacebacteria bacterium]|nr:hypothetical protein [Candidatus Paceibacterota bacterium]